jgi:uncharacterized repeat protein (TIGR01451 family)
VRERDAKFLLHSVDSCAWNQVAMRTRCPNETSFPDEFNSSATWADTTSNINNGEWHNIVGVYNNAKAIIYFDGAKQGEVPKPVITTNNLPLEIGRYGQDNKYAFDGAIDEIRIYNRALSDSEIKANYEASKAPAAPQLTLTKSLSPSTITEGDSTTVTIRVENTGGDAKSVKITDAIPQGFTLVSGSASQEYATLKATESRTFQYTIKATGTGRFVSDHGVNLTSV